MSQLDPATEKRISSWQKRIFALLWTSYASYYLCRMNFAAAQPEMLREFTDWTRAQVGLIPSVYAIFYATGQFINGQIGSRFGARRMMVIGLVVISACNLLFSVTTSYWLMLVLWAINGYCQAIGWPQVVQTMASWFRVGRRGTMMGLISTCYQGGNVLAWLLAGYLVTEHGWRASFWVPGLIMIPMAVVMLIGMRNQPEDAGLPHIRDDGEEEPAVAGAPVEDWTILRILKVTLASKVLWILALSYFCFNAVRYAFMNWGIQYFNNFHHVDIKQSAFMSIAFPLIGSLGAISSGWVSDRFFQSRRAPVCTVMLTILAGVCLLFIPIEQGAWIHATVILAVAGFMIYGPDAILTGAAAIDLSHPKAAAAAAGFIMATGNLGAALVSGFGVGLILDNSGGDWNPVFYTLAVLSLMSAGMSAILWNEKPKTRSGS
jgi:OPA family glycerol-3-phosphate transporter-like MFS transporter